MPRNKHTKKKIAGEVYKPCVFRIIKKKPDGSIGIMERVADDETVDISTGENQEFAVVYVLASMVNDN